MIKKILAGIAFVAMVSFVVAPALAADTGGVSATVTPKLIAVSVSDGSVEYGTMDLNDTKSTIDLEDTQTVTDGSNVPVALNIKSSDALGGTTWELAAAVGLDAFVHKFKGGDVAVWTQLPVDHSYTTLDDSPAAASVDFDLQITTPNATTDHVEKIITVTVQVTG